MEELPHCYVRVHALRLVCNFGLLTFVKVLKVLLDVETKAHVLV